MKRFRNYPPGVSGSEPQIQGWDQWEQSHDAEFAWELTGQAPDDDDDDDVDCDDDDDDDTDADDDSDLEVKEDE